MKNLENKTYRNNKPIEHREIKISYGNILRGLALTTALFVFPPLFLTGYTGKRLENGESKEKIKIEIFENPLNVPNYIKTPLDMIGVINLEVSDWLYKKRVKFSK